MQGCPRTHLLEEGAHERARLDGARQGLRVNDRARRLCRRRRHGRHHLPRHDFVAAPRRVHDEEPRAHRRRQRVDRHDGLWRRRGRRRRRADGLAVLVELVLLVVRGLGGRVELALLLVVLARLAALRAPHAHQARKPTGSTSRACSRFASQRTRGVSIHRRCRRTLLRLDAPDGSTLTGSGSGYVTVTSGGGASGHSACERGSSARGEARNRSRVLRGLALRSARPARSPARPWGLRVACPPRPCRRLSGTWRRLSPGRTARRPRAPATGSAPPGPTCPRSPGPARGEERNRAAIARRRRVEKVPHCESHPQSRRRADLATRTHLDGEGQLLRAERVRRVGHERRHGGRDQQLRAVGQRGAHRLALGQELHQETCAVVGAQAKVVSRPPRPERCGVARVATPASVARQWGGAPGSGATDRPLALARMGGSPSYSRLHEPLGSCVKRVPSAS